MEASSTTTILRLSNNRSFRPQVPGRQGRMSENAATQSMGHETLKLAGRNFFSKREVFELWHEHSTLHPAHCNFIQALLSTASISLASRQYFGNTLPKSTLAERGILREISRENIERIVSCNFASDDVKFRNIIITRRVQLGPLRMLKHTIPV